MDQNGPLVTIGIPTFNRAASLKRAIDSALSQDYLNIEVIVSDNASTDETVALCQHYNSGNMRFKYIRQLENIGPTRNFFEVLKNASGEFFMWLGDDDWIDREYVTACIKEIASDRSLALVSGLPRYYHNGQSAYIGNAFNLSHDSAWHRVISYYAQVTDNGIFYGLLRTAQIKHLKMRNTMGCDWLLIACVAFMGKTKVLTKISIHRELGGMSGGYQKIADSLGLPKCQALFPALSIAISAGADIIKTNTVYHSQPLLLRLVIATAVLIIIALRPAFSPFRSAAQHIKTRLFMA